MNDAFLTVLNMSITGAFVIAAIILFRPLFRRAPKAISYALWSVAGFRLALPIRMRGLFSLVPFKPSPIPHDIATRPVPRLDSGIAALDRAINRILPPAAPAASANPLQIWLFLGTSIWLAGIALMIVHSVVSWVILKRGLAKAKPAPDGAFEARNLRTPLVLGFLHPRIYLPEGLPEEERRYILLHEQTHIKRHDHVVKMLAYLVLCLHWFNPLAWAAFLLMSADMEMSCDECVLSGLGQDIPDTKEAYSMSLVRMAAERPILNGSPLAFGEGGMKERVKHVLSFKKPSRVVLVVSVALVILLAYGLALSRKAADLPELTELTITTPRGSYSPLMSSMFGFQIVVDEFDGSTEFTYECDRGSFCSYSDGHITALGQDVSTAETVYWWPFQSDSSQDIATGDTSIVVTAFDREGKVAARGTAIITEDDRVYRFTSDAEGFEHKGDDSDSVGLIPDEPEPPQIPTGEPYSSAGVAARLYLSDLGYKEGAIMALYSVVADYSGDPDILSRLKGETVTLGIDFREDPASHPLRAIVLTREPGQGWEVVHTKSLPTVRGD